MKPKIDGDALVGNRGGKTKLFNKKRNELTAGYLKTIKTAINKHLKKVDDKTNSHDVVKHLDDAGLTNHRISGYTQFIDLVDKHVNDHSDSIDLSGPSPPKQKRTRTKTQYDQAIQDKAMAYFAYLRSNFHLHSIKFDRAYIVGKLRDKKSLNYNQSYHHTPYMQWTH